MVAKHYLMAIELVITPRLIWSLGFSQLVLWGISFYLIGVFGDLIILDTGWSRPAVYGGFSVALLAMAGASPMTGKIIDQVGGRYVMLGGSVLCAASCTLLSFTSTLIFYYAAWIGLGIAMRCTLYDAAFATLAYIGGVSAKRAIAQITLLGGLAATCFWPIGHFLAEEWGWRGALRCYAVIALLIAPLHLFIPHEDSAATQARRRHDVPAIIPNEHPVLSSFLYASIIALGNGLHSGMSAHLISILSELGLGVGLAVSVAALRGVGQSAARLLEVLFGKRLHPINLNLIAAAMLPLCFLLALLSGGFLISAIVFSLSYGGATGLLTITRGTLPLVLFDHATYGAKIGKLLVPSFLISAVSPLVFAYVIERAGVIASLSLSLIIAVVILLSSIILVIISPSARIR